MFGVDERDLQTAGNETTVKQDCGKGAVRMNDVEPFGISH